MWQKRKSWIPVLWQANISREKSDLPSMEKEQHKKKSFPAAAEKWGVILGGRKKKSCKYCFNKSLWLAYYSMCCCSNVSYSCLHTHWSEVIPLPSHPKGDKAGQKILHFRQQIENFFPWVHNLPSIYVPMNPTACVLPRCVLGSHLTLLVQRDGEADRDEGNAWQRLARLQPKPSQHLLWPPPEAAHSSDLVEHFWCCYTVQTSPGKLPRGLLSQTLHLREYLAVTYSSLQPDFQNVIICQRDPTLQSSR